MFQRNALPDIFCLCDLTISFRCAQQDIQCPLTASPIQSWGQEWFLGRKTFRGQTSQRLGT
jgi:hypothetical protein